MMKTYLKRAFQLSDSGVKGLAKSIWSFFLYYVSFVPPMICVFLFADRLLNGNTGKPVVYLLFMLAATLVMYLVINYNYPAHRCPAEQPLLRGNAASARTHCRTDAPPSDFPAPAHPAFFHLQRSGGRDGCSQPPG